MEITLKITVRAQNFCQNFSKFLSKTFPKYFRKRGENHSADFRPFFVSYSENSFRRIFFSASVNFGYPSRISSKFFSPVLSWILMAFTKIFFFQVGIVYSPIIDAIATVTDSNISVLLATCCSKSDNFLMDTVMIVSLGSSALSFSSEDKPASLFEF